MPGGHDISSALGDAITRSVNADRTIASTTPVIIPDLSVNLSPGAYVFWYFVVQQSAATTTGYKSSVQFTGTKGIFNYIIRWLSPTTTASDDVATGAFTTAAGGVVTGFAARTPTASGTGVVTDVDVINVDVPFITEGIISVTAVGSLDFYWAPEAAANATLKAGSSLLLWRTG